jgi:hypothetical protein
MVASDVETRMRLILDSCLFLKQRDLLFQSRPVRREKLEILEDSSPKTKVTGHNLAIDAL